MARPSAMDEYFVHQIPELLPNVQTHHHHWRESYFYELHDPSAEGDAVFFTFAHYPAREMMDSIQMGRVGGEQILGVQARPYDGDPHTTEVPGARIEVIEPMREVRLFADPEVCAIGLDLVWRSRAEPYGLRRGTMRAGHELVWDQCHIFQSGIYEGTYTVGGVEHSADGWIGQRDHSWGIRDHGRCPLWMWFQLQFDDGYVGVWNWEYPNGARVYTDGCWAPTDGSDPVPLVWFEHDVSWRGADGAAVAYGTNGDSVAGLAGTIRLRFEDGRRLEVSAEGSFARPYEPFHRGGLNLMKIEADDGRTGTAIYEVTGARHHHFFPDTEVPGPLPS